MEHRPAIRLLLFAGHFALAKRIAFLTRAGGVGRGKYTVPQLRLGVLEL